MTWRRALVWFVLIGAALGIPYAAKSSYQMFLVNMAGVYVILTLGVNFSVGLAGQFNLAQVGFWAVGSYVSALTALTGKIPVGLCFVLAVVISSVFGYVVGLPTLRMGSRYLSVVTIGFTETVRLVLNNWKSFTGGPDGLSRIPPVTFAGRPLTTYADYFYLTLAAVLVAVWVAYRVRWSKLGRALQAIRDSEVAAEAMGIDAYHHKTLAFVLSAAYGGLAGALYVHLVRFVGPQGYNLGEAVRILCMLYIGGSGSIIGPVTGGILLTILPEWLRFLKSYYMAMYGLGIMIIMVAMPTGVAGLMAACARHLSLIKPGVALRNQVR